MHFQKLRFLPLIILASALLKPSPLQAAPAVKPSPLKPEVSSTLTSAAMAKRSVQWSVLESTGWKTPRPPYPYQARATHDQGVTYVQVTTDVTGKVVRVVVPRDNKHPLLEQNSAYFALYHWHGPPNKTVIVTLLYRLV